MAQNDRRFSSYARARSNHPEATAGVANHPKAWKLIVGLPDGTTYSPPPGSDILLDGFAGTMKLVVALSKNGEPMFDKVLYEQKPGVDIVAWGRDASGVVRIAYLTQVRPFAYDPHATECTELLVFGQIPMGFLNPEDLTTHSIGVENAVRRELSEEAGVKRVISIELPEPLTYWQDPTFMQNGAYVAFAEIELATATGKTHEASDGEQITRVEFITVPDLLARIAQGRTPDGVIHHMGLSLGPLMMFFARHPELLSR